MAVNVASEINLKSETGEIRGIVGVSDNDVVIDFDNAERWNSFILQTTTGVVEVDVSAGLDVFKSIITLEDLHSTTPATRVVITAATKIYRFTGTFKRIRVRQASGTAAVGTVLLLSRPGRG